MKNCGNTLYRFLEGQLEESVDFWWDEYDLIICFKKYEITKVEIGNVFTHLLQSQSAKLTYWVEFRFNGIA